MGREIRMVPPNWEHPRNEQGDYKSLYDKDYDTAAKEWMEEFEVWKGESEKERDYKYYWEYNSPPDEDLCRPKFTEEPTWYQVYETVSEGSPVSPPFATKKELIEYLVQYGDFWTQKQGNKPPSREAITNFVNSGHCFSMTITNGTIKMGIDSCD